MSILLRRRCVWCKNIFEVSKLEVKRGRGNYCSKGCQREHRADFNTKSINRAFLQKKVDKRLALAEKLDLLLEEETEEV